MIILVACEGSIVKTGRDNGSFSNISLTECQEALSERQFGKQNMTPILLVHTKTQHL